MPALDIAYDDPRPRLLCGLADSSARICMVEVIPAPDENLDVTERRIRRRIAAVHHRHGLNTRPIYLGYIPEGFDAAQRAMLEVATWNLAFTIRGWTVPTFDPTTLSPSLARDGWRYANQLKNMDAAN